MGGKEGYSILSSVIALCDAGGSSSKGDVTLYKDIGGSVPKSCKVHFVTGHKKVKSGHTCASFLPLRIL
jgi:hypothetical protein